MPLILMPLGVGSLFSSIIPGSDLLYMSRSLESFSLGGVSTGLEMKGGNFIVNPALASTSLQKVVVANLGYSTESINAANIGYLHPTQYGVFGGYFGQFFNQGNSDFFFTLGAVFSKEVTQTISLGAIFMVDFYRGSTSLTDISSKEINVGGSASISISLHPSWNYARSVFTIREFIASIQLDQLGFNNGIGIGSTTYYLKTGDIAKLGMGVSIMQAALPNDKGSWRLRLYSDVALNYPLNFSYHVGLKNAFSMNGKFEEISIMVGHFNDPALSNPVPITGGIGTIFMIDDEIKMEVAYALGFNRRDSIESYHSLGFNIYFGEVDNKSPEIFSPFGDEGVINEGEIE